MDDIEAGFEQAKQNHDPKKAIEVAYAVALEYHKAGRPELKFHYEEDEWHSEGPLSGGSLSYVVYTDTDGSVSEYEYRDEMDTPEDSYAVCTIMWGRHAAPYESYVKISIHCTNKTWSHHQALVQTSARRVFIPNPINTPDRPHIPASKEMIFDWLDEFIVRPEDIGGKDDIEFVVGKEAIPQIEAEFSNLFTDPELPTLVSPEYLTGYFNVSWEFVFEVVDKLLSERKINEVDVPPGYHEAIMLLGAASEWDHNDTVSDEDHVGYHA